MSLFTRFLVTGLVVGGVGCMGDGVSQRHQAFSSCFDTGHGVRCIATPGALITAATDVDHDTVLDRFVCGDGVSDSGDSESTLDSSSGEQEPGGEQEPNPGDSDSASDTDCGASDDSSGDSESDADGDGDADSVDDSVDCDCVETEPPPEEEPPPGP